jgi:DNA-binding SARP family transcriptional activator/tetratricopeptide (TPR) repeat protein
VAEFRILGPLEVSHEGRPVQLGGYRQRALLARLLLDANRVVSRDRLIEDLWRDTPPEGVANALEAAVSRLRRAAGSAAKLVTRSPGYVLEVSPQALDVRRFEDLRTLGSETAAAGDPETAAQWFREALSVWRGPALADFAYEPFAQGEIARLDAIRLATIEERVEMDLLCGRHGEVVAEVESLIREHPLRERLRAFLMLALYRSGRQADALDAYRAVREILVEELGIEPGPELRSLQERILHQDPEIATRATQVVGRPMVASGSTPGDAAAVADVRKTVTVVCCHFNASSVVGEGLDPERMTAVMARVLEVAAAAFRRHGGMVEKLLGGAITAVFGIPELHDDDALRAMKASHDLTTELGSLHSHIDPEERIRLEAGIGVSSGEVIVGAATGEVALTGGPIAAATRLALAASPRDVLIGEMTKRLASSAVVLEPAFTLTTDGARGPRAWRLLDVIPGAPPFDRRVDVPFAGREPELAELRHAFDRAVEEEKAVMLTVVGPPGIGKTRLAQEFGVSMMAEGSVYWGRCLPYGEGITYWPLREIVLDAFGEDVHDGIRALLNGDPEAASIADRVAGAVGLLDKAFPAEEIAWASRRMLESLGKRRPVAVILEDVHWAAPTFLDLVENIAKFATHGAVCLLCLARPELVDDYPGWGQGITGAQILWLEPLGHDDARVLAANLVEGVSIPTDRWHRAIEMAEGNPLFLEQLLTSHAEASSKEAVPIPPTIAAVLAARLERLGPGERMILERAAVVGKEFALDALAALLPEAARAPMPRHLETLVEKRYVRLVPSPAREGEAAAFRHILIVEAAYRRLPKAVRLDLHERLADWMEDRLMDRMPEYEEIVGHHLERAHGYAVELAADPMRVRVLANRAAARLAAAGRRAFSRSDAPAAELLLRRAANLMPEADAERLELEVDLAQSIFDRRGRPPAIDHLRSIIRRAEAVPDALRARSRARIRLEFHQWTSSGSMDSSEAIRVIEEEGRRLRALGDRSGHLHVLDSEGWILYWSGHCADAEAVANRLIALADDLAVLPEVDHGLGLLAGVLRDGPTPADRAIARIEELLASRRRGARSEASLLYGLPPLYAMQGRFEEARRATERLRSILTQLGMVTWLGAAGAPTGDAEAIAGDDEAAERLYRQSCDVFEHIGSSHAQATMAARVALAMLRRGRVDEARPFVDQADALGSPDEWGWRRARAKLLQREGRLSEAESLLRQDLDLAARTDYVTDHADNLVDLAEVVAAAGHAEEANDSLDEALVLYEAKGNVVAAARVRALRLAINDG